MIFFSFIFCIQVRRRRDVNIKYVNTIIVISLRRAGLIGHVKTVIFIRCNKLYWYCLRQTPSEKHREIDFENIIH